jgi:hypothetical protein
MMLDSSTVDAGTKGRAAAASGGEGLRPVRKLSTEYWSAPCPALCQLDPGQSPTSGLARKQHTTDAQAPTSSLGSLRVASDNLWIVYSARMRMATATSTCESCLPPAQRPDRA